MASQVEQLRDNLQEATREWVEKDLKYIQSNRERMDYGTAKERAEPLGSGAMESTCRQYQVRFKRMGQYWSRNGDESLLCLESFWRNGRWQELFPHAKLSDLSKN